VRPGSQFNNNGPIDVYGDLLVNGAFANNATITIDRGVGQFQSATTGTGTGAIVIGEAATLAFTGFFANNSVAFEPGETGRLLIGTPFVADTLKTIIGFDAGDSISIPGQGAGVAWQQAPDTGNAPSGVLVVANATGGTLAAIPFTGAYDPGAFAIAYDAGTDLTTITTSKAPPPPPVTETEKPTTKQPVVVQSTDPVLDLDFHGFRDLKGKTANGPNDVTLELTKTTIRDTALQRADFLDGSLVFGGDNPDGRYVPDLEASQIARMYYTVLGRAPEFAGAYGWVVDQMQARNLSIRDLAPGFYNSPEFKQRFGENTTDQEFVSLLYRNVLGREAEPGGVQFWTGRLASGVDRAEVVVGISESFEHQAIRFNDIEANGIRFFGDPFL